ncbi:MAG: 3-hydroxyacyl-CoA dehydrogenase family protein [Candidatus Lokiarchaeota archaeon]|nr:3-hydroxyacyl-CoA dehydrogenase family protein [Candidatus Lokiarchaeota archaeon]MBD3339511.1 3-hydroxyacyl-CoA dehydrogenase family protein [Candidatus Lokiarchaeota archaeon]
MSKSKNIKNIAIIGAGEMGHGIAQIALMAGYNVNLADIKEDLVKNAVSEIESGLKKAESKGKLQKGQNASDLLSRLNMTTKNTEAVKNCDFMIEAVIEKMEIKKQVFEVAADNAPEHTILASNTSTMSISEIAKATNRPEKVIGMHFFNPPILMRLIEVIHGEKSSEKTIKKAKKLGKTLPCLRGDRYIAEVLKDRPGFIVNRLNAPVQIYMSWVFDKAEEKKIGWEQIDADAGGIMPMPPCMLMDFTGIDTVYHTMKYYEETLSEDFKPGKVITRMYNENKLGQKTGEGFYDWSKGRDAIKIKYKNAEPAGLFNVQNTMAIMLNEGCRILKEEITESYKVIDKANMAGMNTPGPFGPGKRSYEKWSEKLVDLADKTDKDYLAPIDLMKSGKFKDYK